MKVFIWFLYFLPIVYAADHYDYVQLVLHWPPTVCGGTCTPPVPRNFTIRGLWPSDSTRPTYPINPSEFENWMPKLNELWSNLTGDDTYISKNQWETQSICSWDSFNKSAYFLKLLYLRANVDILGYLAGGGIKPLPPKVVYRSSDISDVIEQGTGRKPRLSCKDNKLLEISVCYDVTLAHRIDCPPQLQNYPKHKCNECVGFPP